MDKMKEKKYYVKDEYLMLSVKYLNKSWKDEGVVVGRSLCIHENDEEVMYFMF